MSHMIVRFGSDSGPRWGVLTSQAPRLPTDQVMIRLLDIDAATTGEFIGIVDAKPELLSAGPVTTVLASALLSPVTSDATLICQGLNYADHAAEAGHHERKANLIFAKASSSLSGPFDNIIRPADVELLDYEIEVGVVLRSPVKSGTFVTDQNIGNYVAGVTLCNDVSARDTMFGASFLQWFQGKSYRTFCPTGPILYLLEPAEVAVTLDNLEFQLTYNGQIRQSANTRQQVYKPAETLTQLAEIMDLKAGDMVLTGTPGGVIAQGTPKLMESLRVNLLNDVQRRADMRTEMKTLGAFLQPGETVSLTLRDVATARDLGGQHCMIAEA